ncbi:hypothetical protein SNE40_016900 [Patella caerulea]|uniref:Transmembrane protein 144 n=1 Tax=Patella caerulea TaxID=87958 RepID=A0AAN8JCU5_PATCE
MEYLRNITTTISPTSDITTMITNSTTASPSTTEYPEYLGFICAIVAVVFYGSNFVPVKKYETGDGMFFQWILCTAIFICGLIFQIIRTAKFYPIVTLGGVLWATGNVCVVPIIKTIGLGLGMCIWGMSNLVAGWATGTFGLFGTEKAKLANETMNYAGVALAAFSTILYVLVKSEVSSGSSEVPSKSNDAETQRLLDTSQVQDEFRNAGSLYASSSNEVLVFNKKKQDDDETFIDKMSPGSKKITGIVLSLVSGLLYGVIFTPSLHVQYTDKSSGSSQDSLDYVFNTFCGIYLASTVYFVIYCALMKNKPRIYPEVVLPGIVSGIMWAIATMCWFVANEALKSEAVTFPIITTCPALMATLVWGVLVFKEIKGKRNFLILIIAGSVSVTGAVLAGLSAG